MARGIGLCLVAALALSVTGIHTYGAGGSAGEGSTRAFLIGKADMGFHYGTFEADCPQGFELTLEESYLASLSPAQREWMLRPENAFEYGHAWKSEYLANAAGGNVCSNPKSFKDDPRRRPYRGVASAVSYGLSLDGTSDGRATPKTCAHQKFAGLNGEPVVDNQLYRASGCSKLNRGTGLQSEQYFERSFLIELRGVDDIRNDAQVEMAVYSLADGENSLKSATGSDVAYQTFTVTANPRWRVQAAARIVEGVLTSDPIPMVHLSRAGGFAAGRGNYAPGSPERNFVFAGEFEFRDVRFRLTFQPDGLIAGVMANYRPIDNIYLSEYAGGRGTASIANNDCAAEYNTLARFADAYPDPATGECTAISAAQNIAGVPAFVVQPK